MPFVISFPDHSGGPSEFSTSFSFSTAARVTVLGNSWLLKKMSVFLFMDYKIVFKFLNATFLKTIFFPSSSFALGSPGNCGSEDRQCTFMLSLIPPSTPGESTRPLLIYLGSSYLFLNFQLEGHFLLSIS